MLAEFKAMPAFPVGAKESFKVCKSDVSDEFYTYKASSDAVSNYNKKLQNDNKPNQDVIVANGKKTEAPAKGAANDFSDLNSPETQAKIAKMTDAEKMKFAMEIQERMKNNKNVQAMNAINKPSPLLSIISKLNVSSQNLQAVLTDYSLLPFQGYGKCSVICSDQDPTCAEKMKACENKYIHDFFNTEIKRYNAFIQDIAIQFNSKKAAFENDLKEFDTQASKYKKEEIAADYANVFLMISRMAAKQEEYERLGAQIIIDAKNNAYCKKDY